MNNYLQKSFINNSKSSLFYLLSVCFAALILVLSFCTVMTFDASILCFALVSFTFFMGLGDNNHSSDIIKAFKLFSLITLSGVSFATAINAIVAIAYDFRGYYLFLIFTNLVVCASGILLILSALEMIKVNHFNVIIFIVGIIGCVFFFVSCIVSLATIFTAYMFLALLFETAVFAFFYIGLMFDRTNELKPE